MVLDILICCYNDSINNVEKIILPPNENITYKISHQISSGQKFEMPVNLQRDDVVVSQVTGTGLSKNRNNSLKMANGDICLIADDDVKYEVTALNNIIKLYKESSYDIICGKIKTFENQPEYKGYAQEQFDLKHGDVQNFSSIEISFLRRSIEKHNIQFDARFGLGSGLNWNSGEETIFLSDCFKKGLKMKYVPEYFVMHNYESSGKANKIYTGDFIEARTALLLRIYNIKGFIISVIKILLLYPKYKNTISFYDCLVRTSKGIIKELRTS